MTPEKIRTFNLRRDASGGYTARRIIPSHVVAAVNGGVKELGTGRGVWHVIGLGASVTVGGFCAG